MQVKATSLGRKTDVFEYAGRVDLRPSLGTGLDEPKFLAQLAAAFVRGGKITIHDKNGKKKVVYETHGI